MTTTTPVVGDARPPLLLIRMMNPVMRAILPTPLGRLVRPFALLVFEGRSSARRFAVPVGYHEVDGERLVFTPASWRRNFRGGIPATVWFRGRATAVTGTLDDDPDSVAASLRSLARSRRGSLTAVGIKVPAGHEMTARDVVTVDRAAIRFT
jgi:hypothetical protein